MQTIDADRVVWALPEMAVLSWRSWDADEVVVFNEGSGQTHLLDAFSAAVLREVEKGPMPFGSLLRNLSQELGLGSDKVRTRLAQTVGWFEQLGLAEAK